MNRFRPRHAALLLVFVGLLLAVNLAVAPRRRAQQTRSCQTNLKLIALGMMQYIRDYDEIYPPTARWADGLSPYMSRRANAALRTVDEVFRCPTTGASYAYNANLATNNVALTAPQTVWVFEVEASQTQCNLSDKGALWPASPIHQRRPIWGNNVLNGDGSVKLAQQKPPANAFTLQLRAR